MTIQRLILIKGIFCLVIGWGLCGCMIRTGQAAETDRSETVRLAVQAMQAEADGDFLTRERLLSEAAHSDNDCAAIRWMRGQLQGADGQWSTVDQAIDQCARDSQLVQYEKLRANQPNNPQGHWQMARLAARLGLDQQCRGHLLQVLRLDPDHVAARSCLGYQLLAGQWIGPEDIQRIQYRNDQTAQSLTRFGQLFEKLSRLGRTGLQPSYRAEAQEALDATDDPLAVFAIEAACVSGRSEAAKLAIPWLAKIDDPLASQALARLALFSSDGQARSQATESLRAKPFFDFVPELLAALSGGVQAMVVPSVDRRGIFVGYRVALAKEGQDEMRILLLDRSFQRDRTNNLVNGNSEMARAFNEATEMVVRLEASNQVLRQARSVNDENAQIARRNAMVANLISEVAGKEFPRVPQDVWQWWDQYSESNRQAFKPTRYRRDQLTLNVPRYDETPVQECFVAGTPVTTSQGLRPIETLITGDLVLSKNPQTGQLSWKPVVARTVRPPEKTVVIEAGSDLLKCTTGHPLWVSGKGWQKAGELIEGQILHGATEPVIVMSVTQATPAETFNLEIADNHTYFVGRERLLSHDVTARGQWRESVPGLRLAQANVSGSK